MTDTTHDRLPASGLPVALPDQDIDRISGGIVPLALACFAFGFICGAGVTYAVLKWTS